jgi:aspartate racemase
MFSRYCRHIVFGLVAFMFFLASGCVNERVEQPEQTTFVTGEHFNEGGMKTIGLIGGVSWVSSAEYYRLLNEEVAARLGGLHSARMIFYSIEFGEFSQQEKLAAAGNWEALNNTMVDAAKRLEAGGADFIIIASNTLNSTAGLIEAEVKLSVLHIADAVGRAIRAQGIDKVILLGTAYTMEEDFYRKKLEDDYGLTVIIPNREERVYINDVIFNELCAGLFTTESREGFVQIINRLIREDEAEGVILGCTEIPLLIKQEDVSIPVFDSTSIHVKAAVDFALDLD